MSNAAVILVSVYLGLNFLCAVGLHLHAQRQAHLPLRWMDVVVHFVLLTLFALPVLGGVLLLAVFGHEERPGLPPSTAHGAAPAARAA